MLLSMTGYGEASHQGDELSVSVEVRAVNNRYLKVLLRAPEPYNLLEAEFEKVIRGTVKRGTLQVQLRCQRRAAPENFVINATALRSYLGQVRAVCEEMRLKDMEPALLAGVLALPGVVPEAGAGPLALNEEWPVIRRVLDRALAKLQQMRQEEGRAMAAELLLHRDRISAELARIHSRTLEVASGYRDRLLERVRSLVKDLDLEVDKSDLIKEVSIFAERSDIAEEVVRLGSHLEQFQGIVNEPESAGRKLEFLTQEMFRETNTIGSKASDVGISQQVVEIKSTLEKIRELVQNVE